MFIKELSHHPVGLLRFRKTSFILEAMIKSPEDDQLRIHARMEKCPMENCGPAHHHVARAGHKERRRHAMQVGSRGGSTISFAKD
jgi:hypothetical protein